VTVPDATKTESELPAAPPRRRRGLFRFLVSAAAAFALVWAVRTFVFDAYRVRERSMWPTLLHDRDRVFVDKTAHRRGAIERYDVVAFLRDGKAYVKRALSVGGETVLLRGGDLFVRDEQGAFVRPPRPSDVVEAMRVEVYPNGSAGAERFVVTGGVATDAADGGLSFEPSGDGVLKAVLRPTTPGVDLCVRDDHPGADDRLIRGRSCVPDVRVEARGLSIEAGATFSIAHRLRDEERVVESSPEGMRVLTTVRGEEPRIAVFPGAPRPSGLRVETLDGIFTVLELRDGAWRTLASEPRPVERFGGWSTVAFEVRGGGARLGSLVVSRDAHYVDADGRDESPAWFVPKGELFLVGDNVPVSVDSRTFGTVKPDEIVGEVVRTWRR
jgi:signal peptidase I